MPLTLTIRPVGLPDCWFTSMIVCEGMLSSASARLPLGIAKIRVPANAKGRRLLPGIVRRHGQIEIMCGQLRFNRYINSREPIASEKSPA